MARPKPSSLQAKQFVFKDSVLSLKLIPRFFKKIRSVHASLFYTNIFLRLADAFVPILMLWVGKLIIDEVILQASLSQKEYDNIIWYVGLEFGLAVLSDVLNRAISLTDGLLGDTYANQSSVEIIQKTSQLSLGQLEDATFYDKLERARQQVTGRVSLLSSILTQSQDFIIIFTLLAGIISFEPWLIVLLLLSIVPTIVNEIKFSGTSYSLARSWTTERRELDYLRYAGASDVTAKEVKLFGLADFLALRFKMLANKYFLANKALAIRRASWGVIFNFLGALSYYIAYIVIVYRALNGLITIGDLTFLAGSIQRVKSKMQSFFIRFTSISESALFLQDYFDFLDLPDEEYGETNFEALPESPKVGFRFENIGFQYPNSEKWVVRHINFTLKASEKLAFVGENGAGKTTLIKLLLRFYEPTEGTIYLDEVPIHRFKKSVYQQYFGVIFQDFVKFELTVRENIAVGKIKDIDNDTKILEAADKSLAIDVIDDLPTGLEQQLGRRFKNGKDLSGGQWQKIALARAYMKDAKVLVLDEPTSALDARAEYEAFQRFIALTEGKTAILISHRFSTVRMADRILVLKNGTVHEIGTHQELMDHQDLYAELFALQAAGYK